VGYNINWILNCRIIYLLDGLKVSSIYSGQNNSAQVFQAFIRAVERVATTRSETVKMTRVAYF
jgi:hypothetical protein